MDELVKIIFMAAEFTFGYTQEEILSSSRNDYIPMSRHLIVWYLVTKKKFTQEKAGYYVKRDHSNVHNSLNVINNIINKRQAPYIDFVELFLKNVRKLIEYSEKKEIFGMLCKMDFPFKEIRLSIQRQNSSMILVNEELTIVTNDNVEKVLVPEETSLKEFLELVLSKT